MLGTDMQEPPDEPTDDEILVAQCRKYVKLDRDIKEQRAIVRELIGDRNIRVEYGGAHFFLRRNLDNVFVTELESI